MIRLWNLVGVAIFTLHTNGEFYILPRNKDLYTKIFIKKITNLFTLNSKRVRSHHHIALGE
jgi:hypothetical protein